MRVMFNAKVKKFCISLLESAGSFAYTRGVMGELDASIRFCVHILSFCARPVFLPKTSRSIHWSDISVAFLSFQGRSGETWRKQDSHRSPRPAQRLGGRLSGI